MVLKNEMTLFKAIINQNIKHELLYQLSRFNNVHIQGRKENQFKHKLEEKDPFKSKIKSLRQNFTALLRKLNVTEIELKETEIKKERRMEFLVASLYELISHVSEEINFYLNRINELERFINKAMIELDNLKLIKASYVFLESYHITRKNIADLNYINFKVYTTFSKNLDKLDTLFEFKSFPNVHQTDTNFPSIYQIEDRSAFFIFYPKELESELKERINIIHAEEVPILKKYLTPDGINFTRVNNEMNIINNTIVKYENEKRKLRNQNISKFAAIGEVLQNIEEYNWAEHQFTSMGHDRLLLQFYVPIKEKKSVQQALIKKFKDNIILESIDIFKSKKIGLPSTSKKPSDQITYNESGTEILKEKSTLKMEDENDLREKAPTIMKNPRFIRPFEALTRLYGVPSYSEIDPTPFLAITFPLLFGIMFGDIGQGLVLVISGVIGGIVFRNRKGDIKNYSWIVFYCGLGAIFWGFFYGEFFGSEEIFGIPIESLSFSLPLIGEITLQNPLNNIFSIFLFTIFIGVLHINFGWLIQFLNYCKLKKRYLAVSDSLMKIFLLTGGTILIFVFGFNIDAWLSYPYPILLVLIPGILLIILKPIGRLAGISYLKLESMAALMGEGTIETFETILSVLSNILSYIRLLALSLVHISLMLAINTMINLLPDPIPFTEAMPFELFWAALGNQILRTIGLIFGNIVVILLEGLLVFINSLRLHFYEFFSKFYSGTGTDFFAFYLDDDYSIITFKSELIKDVISEEIAKEIETKKTQEDLDKAMKLIKEEFF